MSESLFQISCPSCESVFAVTDPELIGQIVACPKCGGMILVEAAQAAENEENPQNAENKANGETAQNGESLTNVESSFGQATQEKDVKEKAQDSENSRDRKSGEETAPDVEENDASFERSRGGGKFVAGGVALALVGALAFWGARGFDDESTPTSKTNVEAENGEKSEDGENGEDASGATKDEVGGFAPFAVEERTSDGEGEAEFLPNDASTLKDGGNGAFGEGAENEAKGDFGENAQDLSVAANGVGEDAAFGTENNEVGKVGENNEAGANGETAPSETESAAENASAFDENDDDLDEIGDLGELGGLDEGETLNVEENETDDALENLDEEMSAGEKLAGSDESTGFNEADFERANQNDDSENADEPGEVDWSGVASTTNPTLQGALPTLRRERKEIDVDARLALPIKSIEFPPSPVAAIRLLSEFTGVSIVPELETFVLTRPSTNATLDLALRDATAGEALEKVAGLLNWEVCKEEDRILLRSSDANPETTVEERFSVADLTAKRVEKSDETRLEMFELPNNLTAEALAALIKSTVAPETWEENGGAANLTVEETALALTQNASNREKTRILLEGLRAIRGLEPQGDAAPERIIPEKLGWEKLTKKTTFAPLTPVALQNAVEILEKAQKLQAFWDDAALLEAGVGRDSTTAARVENGTLDAVFNEILEPLNAAYVILGENLILVTSKDAAKNYRTVEFFSLVGEDGSRPTLEEARTLVEEIKRTIAPESWAANERTRSENTSNNATSEDEGEATLLENDGVDGDGETAETAPGGDLRENSEDGETERKAALNKESAVIWLDVESSCLIIRQSQPNQRALRRWLTARLAKLPSKTEKSLKKEIQKADEI